MTGNQEEKLTILYARLSEEDARAGRSVSIENQEGMLRAHAEKLQLHNVLFLYDDGITGTTDNRPSFPTGTTADFQRGGRCAHGHRFEPAVPQPVLFQ